MRIIAVLTLACLLTGCGGSPSVEVTVPPPPSLLVPCDDPVRLKIAAMSSHDIEIYWGRDRSALRACGTMHQALIDDLNAKKDAKR